MNKSCHYLPDANSMIVAKMFKIQFKASGIFKIYKQKKNIANS